MYVSYVEVDSIKSNRWKAVATCERLFLLIQKLYHI